MKRTGMGAEGNPVHLRNSGPIDFCEGFVCVQSVKVHIEGEFVVHCVRRLTSFDELTP